MSPSFSCYKTKRDLLPEPPLHIHPLRDLSFLPPRFGMERSEVNTRRVLGGFTLKQVERLETRRR